MQQTIERTDTTTNNRELAARAVAQLIQPLPQGLTYLDLPGAAQPQPRCAQRAISGVRGARPADRSLFAACSERQLTVERTEEAGERVISHVRFSGRHTTSDRGAAASGRLMQATGEIVHELHEGRITDAWSVLRWR